jgi:hypothetical protein
LNRTLDAHIARRGENLAAVVLISNEFSAHEGRPILPRRNYVKVVAQKTNGRRDSGPWNRSCNHTKNRHLR